jgi:hypothetical protein
MECKTCLISDAISGITFIDGECDFCRLHKKLEKDSKNFDLDGLVNKIRTKAKYHCLIGISGGCDSSWMLHYVVKVLKLNPLVIHFDNGWNVPEADHNMITLITQLNVDFIRYHVNQQQYDDVCKSLLMASVPDADIANDMVMAELMVRTAKQYKIKYVFNGHDYRHEGSSPLAWSYMDAAYVKDVYELFMNRKLTGFPMIGFWKQMFQRTKQVRLLYYIDYKPEVAKQILIDLYGWQDYGLKHSENIYTWFVGAYLLPKKFGIDKRITYLSAQIRSGEITKNHAKEIMKQEIPFDPCYLYKIGTRFGEFKQLWDNTDIRSHNEFVTYHQLFRKYRLFLWVLTQIGVLPKTFYFKYCKK